MAPAPFDLPCFTLAMHLSLVCVRSCARVHCAHLCGGLLALVAPWHGMPVQVAEHLSRILGPEVVVQNPRPGRGRSGGGTTGHCLLEFVDFRSAIHASYKLSRAQLHDRPLRVNWAQNR